MGRFHRWIQFEQAGGVGDAGLIFPIFQTIGYQIGEAAQGQVVQAFAFLHHPPVKALAFSDVKTFQEFPLIKVDGPPSLLSLSFCGDASRLPHRL